MYELPQLAEKTIRLFEKKEWHISLDYFLRSSFYIWQAFLQILGQ